MSRVGAKLESEHGPRLAIVLWNGDVGGAEVLSLALAERLSRVGASATLIFIEQPHPLAARLPQSGVPYASLGMERGRDVLLHPRRYAAEVARAGPDGALLIECGFMGGALRGGGYRAPIVAVEHGAILDAPRSPLGRLSWHASRASGAWADDAEVAVSDFVLERIRALPYTRRVLRIYNGIEPSCFARPQRPEQPERSEDCVVGFAGRLVPGKGADYLIDAVARLRAERAVKLRIAGDGPERASLEGRAARSGAAVEFLGLTHDMAGFWQGSDVAAIPSAEFTEACPMTPLEAMAAGRPVVATRNGGLPELIEDGRTGLVVDSADPDALARALGVYAGDSELRRLHGAAARARVSKHFHIDACARAYLDLIGELDRRG